MIRIKKRETKRTKVHLTYEFSFGEKVIEKKIIVSNKQIENLSEKEIWNLVRGQAIKERIKLGRSRPQAKEESDVESEEE